MAVESPRIAATLSMSPPFPRSSEASMCRKRWGARPSTPERLNTTLNKLVHGFDVELIDVGKGAIQTEPSEITQGPFVAALSFIRIVLVLSQKSTHGIVDRLPGLLRGAVFDLRQLAPGAL